MLRFDLIENHWLAVALLGGLALTFAIVLGYLAGWRARSPPPGGAAGHEEGEDSGKVPWVIVLIYAAIGVFAVVYLLLRTLRPPNW